MKLARSSSRAVELYPNSVFNNLSFSCLCAFHSRRSAFFIFYNSFDTHNSSHLLVNFRKTFDMS